VWAGVGGCGSAWCERVWDEAWVGTGADVLFVMFALPPPLLAESRPHTPRTSQINADTTQSAVASSADTAAAAAAAAAAATIPSMHHLNLGVEDILSAGEQKRKLEEALKVQRLEEAKIALGEQFHPDVRKWRVKDVCRWLDTLTLGQVRRVWGCGVRGGGLCGCNVVCVMDCCEGGVCGWWMPCVWWWWCVWMLRRKGGEHCVGSVYCERWCGVEWRGVSWCGVVWCGVAWCGVVWCGVVRCGVAWRGVAWRGVAWRGVAWRGVAWRGVAWRGVTCVYVYTVRVGGVGVGAVL
jgi:hypothetical protein